MPHHDALYFHRALGVGLIPLLFFRIPTSPGWLGNVARLLTVAWLTLLALAAALESTFVLRAAMLAMMLGFAGLRATSVDRDSHDVLLDTICLVAIGIALVAPSPTTGMLLPLFVALCAIAKPFAQGAGRIPGGLAIASVICLASRVLGLWVDAMWLAVFASGLAVCVMVWKGASTLPIWNRWISRLQVIVFAQALMVACLVGVATDPTEVLLQDTLMVITMAHFFWLVPVLAWLQQREEPKGRLVWGAIGLATLGYHVLAWSHFMLGRRGMPWGYFAYDSRFSFGFRLAAVGAVLVLLGAIIFAVWRIRQRPGYPEARLVSRG